MTANGSIEEKRAGVDSEDYSCESPYDQLQIVSQNVFNPKKSQEVTVLWGYGNIQECLLYISGECDLVSPESYHYVEDH